MSAVSIVEGTGTGMLRHQIEAEGQLRADIAERGAKAFALAVTAPDLETGVSTLVQAYGIGPVKANTLMLNWFQDSAHGEDPDRGRRLGRNLRAAYRLGCNVVILDLKEPGGMPGQNEMSRKIDIWWQDNATGRLALILAYLMTRSAPWSASRLRVITAQARAPEKALSRLRQTLEDVRILAEPVVVKAMDPESVARHSQGADLVFFPFRLRWNAVVDPAGTPPGPMLEKMKNTVLIMAAEDIDLDAEPEEGEAAYRAQAQDRLDAVEKEAKQAATEAEAAEQERAAAEAAP